jgi:5-formyltetrahydrofolate cyclo-ligase
MNKINDDSELLEENIESTKKELRQLFRIKRNSLSKEEVNLKSQKICEKFITELLPKISNKKEGEIFGIYLPANNEALTDLIIRYFKEKKIKFSYPKITNKNHPLKFILNEENQTFEPSIFFPKILEPTSDIEVFPEILVLPLLAFDSKLLRLGMGGGFFDRTIDFLKVKNPALTCIGLAYELQKSDSFFPKKNTDRTLDFIVTEKTIWSQN